MEGIFVEMDRAGCGVLMHGKRQSITYCQYSNLPTHLYRLISLSFLFYLIEHAVKSRH